VRMATCTRGSFIALSGAALAAPSFAGAADLTAIKMAGVPEDSATTVLYGIQSGLFKPYGLDVDMQPQHNGPSVMSGVVGGSYQVGKSSTPPLIAAFSKGLPFTIIMPAGIYDTRAPIASLLVASDSPIKKAADLNGKTIATRDLSNMSYFGAKQWIDKNGGDSKSIRWIEISDTSDLAALSAGRIDAASVSEPALDDALRGGNVRSLAPVFDAIAKRFLISGYFTSEAFTKDHPDAVRAFAGVMASTAAWANKNHAQTAKILEKYAQAPVPPESPRVEYADRLSASDVQPVLDLLFTYGVLKVPAHAKDLFSPLVAPA